RLAYHEPVGRRVPCGLLLQERCGNDNLGVILQSDNRGVNLRYSATTERNAMAAVPRRKGARRIAGGKGEAIADLVLEVAQFFFRMRAVGQNTGRITSWGAAAFGFMRSLPLIGPLTVPQIAQMRPTSRQRMQRLADQPADRRVPVTVCAPRH